MIDFAIESATVAIDQFWGHQSDPASTVATLGGSLLFAILTPITVAAAVAYLRRPATPHGEAIIPLLG